MRTECSGSSPTGKGDSSEQFIFSFAESGPPVRFAFDADHITGDAGLAPLRELDERLGLTDLAASFLDDEREVEMTVHPLRRLLRGCVYAQAAGYEDANDHTPLRDDPFFQALVGRIHEDSVNPKKQWGLASEATLSRLLSGRKIGGRESFGEVHVAQFLKVLGDATPTVLTLDIDGYDAEVHGMQQQALFNGYFDHDCYYPLHVTIAEYGFIVGVQLRPGNASAAAGAIELLEPILTALKKHLPKTKLRLRGDAGFADPELYALCERKRVEYAIRRKMTSVTKRWFVEYLDSWLDLVDPDDGPGEWFEEVWHEVKGWPRARRHVLKLAYDPRTDSAERYVLVTNSNKSDENVWNFYAHRGREEQRIDEFKNQLRGEKFSCCTFHANAFKLHVMALAYNLFAALRIVLPAHHELKRATPARLRSVLIKCGAMVRRTVRWTWLHASRFWPHREWLADVCRVVLAPRLKPTPVWNSS